MTHYQVPREETSINLTKISEQVCLEMGGGGGGADIISYLLVSLKCIEHLNDVWMVELLHNLNLFPQTV